MTVIVVIEPDKQRLQNMIELLGKQEPSFEFKGSDYVLLHRHERASVVNPDLVVLCIHSYEDVFELTHASQQVYEPKHMLMVSSTTSVPHSLSRLGDMLAGYVYGDAPADQLLASMRLVLTGGKCFPLLPTPFADSPYFRPAVTSSSNPPAAASAPQQANTGADEPDEDTATAEAEMLGITPRQYEVLVLLGRGLPVKAVSRELNISISTVKAHRETLYQRLDVNNRSEAVYAAYARGASLGWSPQTPDEHVLPSSGAKQNQTQR